MYEVERGAKPQVDLGVIDRNVVRMYHPEFHSNTPLDDGHGTVLVDWAIAALLEDLNRLDFVKCTTSSCAGGSGDGAGGQRALLEISPGQYSWSGYIGFDVERTNALVDRAVSFCEQVRQLEIEGVFDTREVHARFEICPSDDSEQLRVGLLKLPAATLEIVFDKVLEGPQLAVVSHAAWGELHRLIRHELVAEK